MEEEARIPDEHRVLADGGWLECPVPDEVTARRQIHDAVLLDLHLPDMQGPQLVRAYRERAPGIPLVLHSAIDDTPEIDEVRDLVDAVTLKSRTQDVLAVLARLTGVS